MLALEGDEVIKRDGLGADVALLKVGVDHASRLRAGVTHMNGPGTDFFHASSEVGLQAQQGVGRADQAVQAGLVLANFLQEFQAVGVVHLGQLGFDLGADGHHGRVLLGGKGLEAVQERVVLKAVFRHVGHEHGGLGRDQEKLLQLGAFFLAEVNRAHRLGVVQGRLAFFQHRQLLDGLFVTRAGGLAHAVQCFFDRSQVGQAQLGLNDLDIGNRVHLVGDVDHVVVFKAAHHVDDGIGFADVGQKLVAQTFARAGTGHQARNVHKLDNGRHDALGRDDLGQLLQTRIGHLDHAGVGLDGAKGVVFSGDAGFGQGVEKGRFANVGQTHDAAFEAHGRLSVIREVTCDFNGWVCPGWPPTMRAWQTLPIFASVVPALWAALWPCCWPVNS